MKPATSFPAIAFNFSRVFTGLVLFGASTAGAATITQNTQDASGTSSLTQGTNWSNSLAPSAGNDYVSAKVMRTPAVGTNVTFAGDSLTFNSGGSLSFRGSGTTAIISIPSLTLNGTAFLVNSINSTQFTLSGTLNLGSTLTTANSGFQIGSTGGMTVASTITGSGRLTVSNPASTTGSTGITLSHANNSYTGGTLVSNGAILKATADKAFGTGNVSVNKGTLNLSGGATNNYIDNSADLILFSGLSSSAITLNFTGSDFLGDISLDGGSTFLGAGTYSTSQLNTLYGSTAFTGTGSLKVVPEPSPASLVAIGLGILMMSLRRFRSQQ